MVGRALSEPFFLGCSKWPLVPLKISGWKMNIFFWDGGISGERGGKVIVSESGPLVPLFGSEFAWKFAKKHSETLLLIFIWKAFL